MPSYDEALLSRAGDDQHAPQDILPQAGCRCASWLCSPEGVLGSEDLRKARQVQDWPYLNYRVKLSMHVAVLNESESDKTSIWEFMTQ